MLGNQLPISANDAKEALAKLPQQSSLLSRLMATYGDKFKEAESLSKARDVYKNSSKEQLLDVHSLIGILRKQHTQVRFVLRPPVSHRHLKWRYRSRILYLPYFQRF